MKSTYRILSLIMVLAMLLSFMPAARAEEKAVVPTDRAYADVETIWADINALKETMQEAGAQPDEIHRAVMELVLDSDSYADGSLEMNADCFTWSTDGGIACLYSYNEEESRGESEGTPVEVPASGYEHISYRKRGAPMGKDVYLIGPFYDIESNFTDHYKTVANKIAQSTGGTYTLYAFTEATIDNIANAISNGAIVLVDSHGTTNTINGISRSYVRLLTNTGITTADYNSGHAYSIIYNNRVAYMVTGKAISDHMTKDAPNSFVWFGTCSGMEYDTMSVPLMDRGVESCMGYSRTVSFHFDRYWLSSFTDALMENKTVAEAAAIMKSEVGRWDRCDQSSYNTLSKAISNNKAFPIFVSREDPYPSNPEGLQDVYSTWKLFCDHSNFAYAAAKEPTCTEAGCAAHYYCTDCLSCFTDAQGTNQVILSSLAIPALGHDVVNGACTRCGILPGITMWHFWNGSPEAGFSWTYENYDSDTTNSIDTSDNGTIASTSGGGDHYFHMTLGTGSMGHAVAEDDVIEVRYRTTGLPSSRVGTTGQFELWYTTTADDSTFSSSMVLSANVTRLENQWQTVQFTPPTGQTLKRIMFDVLEEDLGYNGARVEIDYLYVGPSSGTPSTADDSYMYFDFTGKPADALRYSSPAYGDRNYDAGYWCSNGNKITATAYDGNNLTATLADGTTSAWVQTSNGSLSSTASVLNYAPNAGDMVQLRFRLENMQAVTGSTPSVRLFYMKNNTAQIGGSDYTTVATLQDAAFNGEYITVTAPMGEDFTAAQVINALRVDFDGVTNTTGKTGNIHLDYVFVGAKDKLPVQSCGDAHTVPAYTTNGDGTHTGFCTVCGESYIQDCTVVEIERAEPSETTDGYILYVCNTGCGYSYKEVLPATGPAPTEPEPTEPEPTEPEPTEPEPTEPEPTDPGKTGVFLKADGNYYYYVNGEICYGAGLIYIGADCYYIRSNGQAATGAYWVTNTNGLTEEGMYYFGDDGKMLLTDPNKNGVILEGGCYYYYKDGEIQYGAGLIYVGGDCYYIRSNGQAAIGSYWVTNTNGLTEEGFYIFAEDGKMILTDTAKNGIYLEGGYYYYYVEGEIQFGAGLIYVDGYYYYIRSGGYAAIGQYWVSNTNGLLPAGNYVFGEDGKMII